MVRRSAFTMIELVLAIVIIAIAMLSLPTMIQSNDQAFENNLVQEAIFGSSAKVMQLLSYSWDDNSRGTAGQLGKVVDVDGGGVYERIGTTKYRVGHVRDDYHRQFHEINATNRAVATVDAVASNDIDDQSVASAALFDNYAANAKAYKKNYTISVAVSYVGDGGAAANYSFPTGGGAIPTNMKMAEVSVSDDDGPVTTLRAYAANIGEVEPFSRRY